MPVIVDMGEGTFKVLNDEPRDQLVRASMDDYSRAIEAGTAKPWREPAQFTYDYDELARLRARHELEAPVHGQYLGDPNYRVPDPSLAPSGGGGGGGYAPAPRRFEYSPSFGAPPAYPPARPTPFNPRYANSPSFGAPPAYPPERPTPFDPSYNPAGVGQLRGAMDQYRQENAPQRPYDAPGAGGWRGAPANYELYMPAVYNVPPQGLGSALSNASQGMGAGLSNLSAGMGGGLSDLSRGMGAGLSSLSRDMGGGLTNMNDSLNRNVGGGLSDLSAGMGGGLSDLSRGMGGWLTDRAQGIEDTYDQWIGR